mmetsp:Transcript_25997/g.75816  ORF Transcript_25997/g.75816 Transcript_25997/m.75816 type:complete len:217 (-) Transcript_25997:699-1349(-)
MHQPTVFDAPLGHSKDTRAPDEGMGPYATLEEKPLLPPVVAIRLAVHGATAIVRGEDENRIVQHAEVLHGVNDGPHRVIKHGHEPSHSVAQLLIVGARGSQRGLEHCQGRSLVVGQPRAVHCVGWGVDILEGEVEEQRGCIYARVLVQDGVEPLQIQEIREDPIMLRKGVVRECGEYHVFVKFSTRGNLLVDILVGKIALRVTEVAQHGVKAPGAG